MILDAVGKRPVSSSANYRDSIARLLPKTPSSRAALPVRQ
jgi:hypothetical protein